MRKCILLLWIVAGLAGQAQLRAQNTILWSVTKTGADTSYLLGTLHQMGNGFVDSLVRIEYSLLQCDRALFESIATGADIRALLRQREADSTYREALPNKLVARLENQAAGWDIPLTQLTPGELRVKLQQEYVKTHCGTIRPSDTAHHFDDYLMHRAMGSGIAVEGLESDSLLVSHVTSKRDASTWKGYRKALHRDLKNLETGRDTNRHCSLVHRYQRFDLDYQLDTPCGENRLLKPRNEAWIPILLERLQEESCLVAVGWLHLVGTCGLITQLREHGYTVEPVYGLTSLE